MFPRPIDRLLEETLRGRRSPGQVIIVGMGHRKTVSLGPVEQRMCPNCHNLDYWELHRMKEYATFFFIPVVPYKTEHLLVCPICKAAYKVSAEELPGMRSKAERNLEQLKGRSR